jgi:transposase
MPDIDRSVLACRQAQVEVPVPQQVKVDEARRVQLLARSTAQLHIGDVSGEEWALVAPYLTLMKAEALRRDWDLRELFNGMRWIVRTGSPWRLMPHDLPPYYTVDQQAQCWFRAGCFGAIAADLRVLIRLEEGKTEQPTAAIIDCPEGTRRAMGPSRTATGAAMTKLSARGGRSCTWRSTRWSSSWRWW